MGTSQGSVSEVQLCVARTYNTGRPLWLSRVSRGERWEKGMGRRLGQGGHRGVGLSGHGDKLGF